nr:dihydroxyacetone kinase phosphoryl donor subunit DhaM [uncultured Cellulomonas sp.]
MTVALVLVAHSRALAEGVAELAGQMAPDVPVLPAGGTDDGRLGTGFDLVTRAIDDAVADGRSAVVLTDLGSAVLTTESVLELADPDVVARVMVVDAPFVEGAVEAAVVAQGGADLDAVADAARRAGSSFGGEQGDEGSADSDLAAAGRHGLDDAAGAASGEDADTAVPSAGGDGAAGAHPATTDGSVPHVDGGPPATTARGTAVLRNRLGLHARPAAQLARTASGFESTIAVNGADARSVLSLVALGAAGGQQLVVTACGPDAARAVRAVVGELEQGFGEA